MSYESVRTLHLFTVCPCVLLGFFQLFIIKKSSSLHRINGSIYVILLAFSALISFFLPAQVGERLANHFGALHLLSIATLATLIYSLWSLKRGDIKAHRRSMSWLYFTGVIIAGAFTLAPGRFLNGVLFH